jgi:hypothetical protein
MAGIGRSSPVTADPETALALAAALQRVANWAGAEMPLSPAAAVALTRKFEIAAHAEVERGVRRVREEGQNWAEIASLLQLDALPRDAGSKAMLAFAYCAGLPAAPKFAPPSFSWHCPACHQAVIDFGPERAQQGHVPGCERLAADVADWEHEQEAPQ